MQARIAGGLWWVCILAGVVGFNAGAALIVANDPAATATNILAKESLFRLGFVADIVSGASYLCVTTLMYCVLKAVSKSLSLLAAFFGCVGLAIGGIAWVCHLMPLILLHGDQQATAFTMSQLQAMSLAFLQLQRQLFPLGMVFFGIQCMSIGYLVARSTFLPRVLGMLLAIGGTFYVLASFAEFLKPSPTGFVRLVVPLAFLGEGALGIWLLAKGVNVQRWNDQAEVVDEWQ
jgi:hypothetical protein